MKLSFCSKAGYMLASLKNKTWLDGLTYKDASDLMYDHGRMTYDRRRSMSNPCNREWADGVQWK